MNIYSENLCEKNDRLEKSKPIIVRGLRKSNCYWVEFCEISKPEKFK